MILYKYTDIDIGLRIIKNRKIRFTQPVSFNDPFDSKPLVNLKTNLFEISELIQNKLDNKQNVYYYCDYREIINLLLEFRPPPKLFNQNPLFLKFLIQQF